MGWTVVLTNFINTSKIQNFVNYQVKCTLSYPTSPFQELLSKLTNQAYQVDNGPTPPGKRVKSLRIKVCQAEGLDPLNLPGPAFCSVGFDGSAVQRTKEAHSGHSSKKLSWNETLHCKHANIINR